MSSTLGLASSITGQEDAVLKGVRRSRLSMHLNSRRVRRWLLIQLVSYPVSEPSEEIETPTARQARESRKPAQSMGQLLDSFNASRVYSNWG